MASLTVSDSLKILRDAGIKVTDASIRYWLRQGIIEGTPPPKGKPAKGWAVLEDSLLAYIRAQQSNVPSHSHDQFKATDKLEDNPQPSVRPVEIDVPVMIYEESVRLGITYSEIVDPLRAQLLEFESHETLLRFCLQELLKKNMKQMFEQTTVEPATNRYEAWSVSELIARFNELRRLTGGTPTKGAAALEYAEIREVLKAKGIPLQVIGL